MPIPAAFPAVIALQKLLPLRNVNVKLSTRLISKRISLHSSLETKEIRRDFKTLKLLKFFSAEFRAENIILHTSEHLGGYISSKITSRNYFIRTRVLPFCVLFQNGLFFSVLLYVYGDSASSLNNNHKFHWHGAKINHRSLSLDQRGSGIGRKFLDLKISEIKIFHTAPDVPFVIHFIAECKNKGKNKLSCFRIPSPLFMNSPASVGIRNPCLHCPSHDCFFFVF